MIPTLRVFRPESVAEATRLLDEHGDDAALYAGGTELLLVMKLGFADYGTLVDVKAVDELTRLDADGDVLHIGAAVSHRRIERSPAVAERWPALAEMTRQVANVRVRSVGTLGGNLCFADPHSDPATFLAAAGAQALLQRDETVRSVPIGEFTLGMFETALEPGEILKAIEVPRLVDGAAMAHEKFALHERPSATVSCHVRIDGQRLADVRIAVGSVGPRPVRAGDAERLLEGAQLAALDNGALGEAGQAAAAAVEPVEDAEGSVAYKRHLVGVLLSRALRSAVSGGLAT